MKQLTMNQTREALAYLSIVDMMHVEGLAAGTVNENAARIAYKEQGGRPVRYIRISSRARKANLDAIAAAVAEAIGEERWAEIVAVVTGEEADTTETTTETAEAAQAAPAAQQADDIAAAILGAIGAPAPAHTVTVTWTNGTRATYSANMLDLLRTDPAAIDIQDDTTGELVYINPATREQQPTENAAQEAPDAEPETVTDMWRAIHEADAELQRAQDPEHIQAQADAMTWHIPDTDWTAIITAAMQGVEL